MHWNHWGGMSWGHMGMGWMWLGWIVLLVALVAAVWFVAAASARRGGSVETKRPGESPEQILKSRYAKGEIQREQYEHMLEDLRH